MNRQWLGKLLSKMRSLFILLVVILGLGLTGCSDRSGFPSRSEGPSRPARIKEVAPPTLIRDLRTDLEPYQPQVQILSPRPDEVLQTQTATVRFAVQDLPLFKDEDLGLGNHLHVFVDDQPYQAAYDPSTPLVLESLAPGSHTIRAFASRAWHESFKNEGAFAEATFHVFAKTPERAPEPNTPLLTYSRPQGSYGAEPIMLDFYLTQVPLHTIAQADEEDDILDWTIRCTINGESFEIDEWRPLYLTGFKPGQNWVQLELLDENGQAIANVFNDTVRIIDYTPNGQDALSRLVRNEIPLDEARRVVVQGYEPPAPEPEEVPVVEEPEESVVEEPDAASSDVPTDDVTEDRLEPTDGAGVDEDSEAESLDIGQPKPADEGVLQVPSTDVTDVEDEDLSPDEMPVEIIVPESQTDTESATEAPLEEVQEQLEEIQEPNSLETAASGAVDTMDERVPEDIHSYLQQPDNVAPSPPAESESQSDASAVISAEEISKDTSEMTDASVAIADPYADLNSSTKRAVESRDDESIPSSEVNTNQSTDREDLMPSPSTPVALPESQITAVKPSPAINSYEAKAILEELEDLETDVEDLKGSIASAADQAPSPEESSSQIESLRSQLEQLKTKFGDTWDRLSDFVRMKLQS